VRLAPLIRRYGLDAVAESVESSTPAPAEVAPLLVLGGGLSLAEIERAEAEELRRPQIDIPVLHRFAPGLYLRTVVMPAGARVIGHEHTTEHFNFVLRGRCLVATGDRVEEIVGPCVFPSGAGVRKVLLILEETVWATAHPTTETNLVTLEATLIRKSPTWQRHAAELAALDRAAAALAEKAAS
jgi:hypothetical protein